MDKIPLTKIRPFWKTKTSIKDPLSFFEEIDKKGDFCTYKGILSFIYLGDPFLVKQVLDKTGTFYNKVNPLYDRFRFILGKGMLTSEGEVWKDQKKSFSPFFSKNNIGKFLPIIFRNLSKTFKKWENHADNSQPLNLSEEFSNLTLGVIGELILSYDFKHHLKEMKEITSTFNDYVAAPSIPFLSSPNIPTILNLKVKNARKKFLNILETIIKKRLLTKEKKDDLLQLILDKNPKEITPLILDQILSLIVAGHETTSNALVWTFYHLSKNKKEKEKLQNFLDKNLRGNFPSFQEIGQLSYVRQVINESLRLSPPVWLITRKSMKEDILGGQRVRPGQMIIFSPYFLHRKKEFWKDPQEFNPNRFSNNEKLERNAFLPFGSGPHACIGASLSMMEMSIFLSVLIRSFDWRHISPFPSPFLSFTMGVKNGPFIFLKKRNISSKFSTEKLNNSQESIQQ